MTTAAPQTGSLGRTLARNSLFVFTARLTQVLTRLALVPLVIDSQGLSGYGVWSLIMSIAAYMKFGSVGVRSAFQTYVAEATVTRDFTRLGVRLSSGCALVLLLSLAALVPAAVYSDGVVRLLGVPGPFQAAAASAVTTLAWLLGISNLGAAFEAILMGAQRIDVARHIRTALTLAEAIAIALLLKAGFGLAEMAAVMAVSEVLFTVACWLASRRVLPQARVRPWCLSPAAVPELVRFAGGYQLVNLTEVIYAGLLPATVLRCFGAEAAGAVALVSRLAAAALMIADAVVQPVLSAGAAIYASGGAAAIRGFAAKAINATVALSLLPLSYLVAFGSRIVLAWTGTVDPRVAQVLPWLCLAACFQSVSLLAMVLYKTSQGATFDLVRQAVRLSSLLALASVAGRLSLAGLVAGLALCEFAGMVWMLSSLGRAFSIGRWPLLVHAGRALAATFFVMALSMAAGSLVPYGAGGRLDAVLSLALSSAVALGLALPALRLSGTCGKQETGAVVSWLRPRRPPKQVIATEQECLQD